MRWLAGLSLAKAIKFALIWPAFLVSIAALVVAAFFLAAANGWTIGTDIDYSGALPEWVTVTLTVLGIIAGPSLLFLALWKLARARDGTIAS